MKILMHTVDSFNGFYHFPSTICCSNRLVGVKWPGMSIIIIIIIILVFEQAPQPHSFNLATKSIIPCTKQAGEDKMDGGANYLSQHYFAEQDNS
jgi:hypothetical protein